jgi:vacuolar protein sorting-associated protein VTA1
MPGIVEMQVPAELKPIQPYLQRANEVKSRDPVMAYQCQLYAAHLSYVILENSKSAESEQFLLILLDDLETLKEQVGQHPAMADERSVSAYILENALKVFAAADTEDRNGESNKYQKLSI